MVRKSKKKLVIPTREELILLLAGRELDGSIGLAGKKPTAASIAKKLKCPIGTVYKCLKHIKDPNAYGNLGWGSGRPHKAKQYTAEQRDWITSRDTLRDQVGKPLKSRAAIANNRFGLSLTVSGLRAIYRLAKITMQKVTYRMKPSLKFSIAEQHLEIEQLK